LLEVRKLCLSSINQVSIQMTNESIYTATLPDGTQAPGKLGDAIKTIKLMKSGMKAQLNQYRERLPIQTVQTIERQIKALTCAVPVLEWELKRRKDLTVTTKIDN
jgi:hypothetical protein